MSDLQVVQTLLDFWDPYGASVYRSSGLGQIGEYDYCAAPIRELLSKNSSEEDLFKFLHQTELAKGGLSRDENDARNRFFAWAFKQVWKTHQSKDTNIRRLHVESVQLPAEEYRIMPRLEILQQYLQQWDPLEASKYWLYGADTLSRYDEASLWLDEAIGSEDLAEVCLALQFASQGEGEGIGFAIENYGVEENVMQEKYQAYMLERSKRHEREAKELMRIFEEPSRSVRRRN